MDQLCWLQNFLLLVLPLLQHTSTHLDPFSVCLATVRLSWTNVSYTFKPLCFPPTVPRWNIQSPTSVVELTIVLQQSGTGDTTPCLYLWKHFLRSSKPCCQSMKQPDSLSPYCALRTPMAYRASTVVCWVIFWLTTQISEGSTIRWSDGECHDIILQIHLSASYDATHILFLP